MFNRILFRSVDRFNPKRSAALLGPALSLSMLSAPQEWPCVPIHALSELSTEFQLQRLISPQEAVRKSTDPSILLAVGVQDAPLIGRSFHASYPYKLLATAACPVISFLTTVPASGHSPITSPRIRRASSRSGSSSATFREVG